MDEAESQAQVYLRSLGFVDIQFEPDGNVPPDFVVNHDIAVEVRRLNQNFDDGSGLRGLEETSIPLMRSIKRYLTALGPPTSLGQSWFVFYGFRRPLPSWKNLKKSLDAILIPFMECSNPESFKADVLPGFWIDVRQASIAKPTFFLHAGHTDRQSGGFLIHEIQQNLLHCIADKTHKIAKYRSRYSRWWLVLADHIGYGLNDFERDLFIDQVRIRHCFDRLVLIDPRDPTRAFEL